MAALYSTLTEIAMIRISSASGTILLPGTSTITGRQVGFKDYLGTLTSNSTVTFSTQNGDYFEDGTTSKTYSNAYAYATFYTGSTSRWNIIGGNALQTMNVSSLQVNSLTIGTGTGWLGLNPIQTLAVSTIQTNTSTLYANTAFMGSASTLTAIQFYGVTGSYSNTVIAEQSTGTGIQEFLVFRGSSASDRIRMQTTGSIVFEPGVSARTFTGAVALTTPTMTMLSNLVGIGTTGTPGALLDVAGTGRFQMVSTLGLNVSSINGAPATQSVLTVSTMIVSSTTQSDGYISPKAKGMIWSQSGSLSKNWTAISTNIASGICYAVATGDYIYYTSNGGATWTQQGTVQAWSSITINTFNTAKAVACVANGGIYYTTNSGTTWTLSSAITANWSGVSSSFNPDYNATINGGGIYYSTDDGATWTISNAPVKNWTATCSSEYLCYAICSGSTSPLYVGTSSSWNNVGGTLIPSGNWNSITAYVKNTSVIGYVLIGRNDDFNYLYNTLANTSSVLPVKGYVGASWTGSIFYSALPLSPINISYNYGLTWIKSASPSLNWSCVCPLNNPTCYATNSLPSGTNNNPFFVGVTSGFIYGDTPDSSNPNTLFVLHNTTIGSDTGTINTNLQSYNISAKGVGNLAASDLYIKSGGNGSIYIYMGNIIKVFGSTDFTGTAGTTLITPKIINMLSPAAGTQVRQPFIQYGKVTTTAGTPYTVTMPYAYSDTTYVVQITYVSTTTTTSYAVSNLTSTTFSISWTGGTTAVNFNWTSFGT